MDLLNCSPLSDKVKVHSFSEHFLQNKTNLQDINSCHLEENETNSLKYSLAPALLFDGIYKNMEQGISVLWNSRGMSQDQWMILGLLLNPDDDLLNPGVLVY